MEGFHSVLAYHEAISTPEWDAELGVWIGEKAPSIYMEEIPDPLYIFGYGSLIWRPGALLELLPSFHCTAIGYKRLFAQRSCDHRGTAKFPGVVLNLVMESDLLAKGYSLSTSCCSCAGVVWLVPRDQAEKIIADLDYREKGGYHRHFISVKLKDCTPHHEADSVVTALVYTGADTNPNFFLPSVIPSSSDQNFMDDPYGLMTTNKVADLIAAAVGPSGPNIDYLFNLVHFLEQREVVDDYLENLASAVRLRIGPWRMRHFVPPRVIAASSANRVGAESARALVLGWGSDEFNQLQPSQHVSLTMSEDKLVYTPKQLFPASRAAPLRWWDYEHYQVLAGGSSSALLTGHNLQLWGRLLLVLQRRLPSTAGDAIVIEGVRGASLGQEHLLLVLKSGAVLALGDNSFGQCNAVPGLVPAPEEVELTAVPGNRHRFTCSLRASWTGAEHKGRWQVLKVAAGLHHSAAITTCGSLLTWGYAKYGQASPAVSPWRPASGAKLIDVACGARHTVVIDTDGVVYSMGSAKYGSLGREAGDGMHAVSLPHEVKFQRVTCGWSHTVVRGVKADGELVFYAWGRGDMAQYGVMHIGIQLPCPLPELSVPKQQRMVEVWCGSEFTVVADSTGCLWGCGWNEHSNLAPMEDGQHVLLQWSRIGGDDSVLRLLHVWEGAVACGGGHVLCLGTESQTSEKSRR